MFYLEKIRKFMKKDYFLKTMVSSFYEASSKKVEGDRDAVGSRSSCVSNVFNHCSKLSPFDQFQYLAVPIGVLLALRTHLVYRDSAQRGISLLMVMSIIAKCFYFNIWL